MLGISTPHGEGVAQLAFFGLFALQHRGQEAAGIAVSDGHRARVHKQAGLVSHVFTNETLTPLTGYHAIGHTRYSTTGSRNERNIQPFLVETMHGPLALAHNGNIVNTPALRDELLSRGFGLTATSDSEVMTLMLAAAGGRDVGGAHRAHAAGVEGRLLARPAGRRPGDRRARPVGLPAAVGRAPPPRRPRRRQRDVRPVDARLRRHHRGRAGRDRHAAGRRAAPPPGARRRPRGRPAARSSSSTSPAPTRCGTAATCTTSASGSAPSWPARRRPTPTS